MPPTHQRNPSDSIESAGLLPSSNQPQVVVKSDTLRLPLNISYTVLLLLTVAYLAISGHASLWKSSLYIGAGVGCFTVLYTITLLVACHRPTHPITSPPSASYPARVCGPLLTIGWALATGFVIAASVRSERIYSENPQWRTWVYAELAAIVLTFLSFILVSILQHLQHRRHEILKDQVKERPLPRNPDYWRRSLWPNSKV